MFSREVFGECRRPRQSLHFAMQAESKFGWFTGGNFIARRFMLGTPFKYWWVHCVHWNFMASHHSVGEGSCTIKTPKRKWENYTYKSISFQTMFVGGCNNASLFYRWRGRVCSVTMMLRYQQYHANTFQPTLLIGDCS